MSCEFFLSLIFVKSCVFFREGPGAGVLTLIFFTD